MTGEKLTYKQITQYAVDISATLTKLGVRRGDVVALGTEQRITIIPTALGIIFSGATFTPYDLTCGRGKLNTKGLPTFLIFTNI